MSIPANIAPYLGLRPTLARGVYVHPSAQVIGEVTLEEDVSVWPGAVVRGDLNSIHIGAGSNIQDLSVLHVGHRSESDPVGAPLVIGDLVTVGHRAILHGCHIGDECLIGMGAIVMDHARIEARVLIGAGSVVPPGKHLESGYLYLGSPVKRVRALTAAELAGFALSAQQYIRLKNNYLGGQGR